MNIQVGTSGWSYKEWRGSFYPPELPADSMLQYYASRFATVEVNNSFYRTPSEAVLAGWAAQVPPDFRFALKASRRITHNSRLAENDGSLAYFLRAVNPLGARRGPTLFQLPPNFRKDASRLADFLSRLPPRWPAAMEFRHDSWFDDEIYRLLRSRDVPLVVVDQTEGEGTSSPLEPTASWGYLRLRRLDYDADRLEAWAQRIERQPWTEAYVFLKHEDGSPTGPAFAQQLKGVLEHRGR
jgi:uncharacterized protein YecE (DUF72 family)